MEFLNPLMLWSALAVGIPIALHFWHQKKGKLLDWAATQWLTEKDIQPAKGIRLDNLLILIIRCLLLIILAFLLSKPLFKKFRNDTIFQKIHLVQPHSLLVNNYKFEIEEALRKGESVVWINENAEPLTDMAKIPPYSEFSPLVLQTCINKVNEFNQMSNKFQYEIYLINNQSLSQVSTVFVPSQFSIHSLIDSARKVSKPYLELPNKRQLFVNQSHQLTVAASLPANETFDLQPIHRGTIHVLLKNKVEAEKQTIKATLKALTEIYQLEFSIDEALVAQKKYDWVFTNREVITNQNVKIALSPALLSDGQLPEKLGELLVNQFQLNPDSKPLSQQQLQALFQIDNAQNRTNTSKEAGISKFILLFFVLLLGVERWLSMKKNA